MELCPYCGKTIVKDAFACKHCGEWLKDISGYLEKKGSIYAHSDHIDVPDLNTNKKIASEKKEVHCIFCGIPANPNEKEIQEKAFLCHNCGKKNILVNGKSDDILKNIPLGWGWLILSAYFIFAIQSYLNMLEDNVQAILTFTASFILLLSVYFLSRNFILGERYEKKKYFGNIYDASIISGTVSTAGVILFVFAFHFVYPFTGLQSDKFETNKRISFYKSKIDELILQQNELYNIISNSSDSKKAMMDNVNHLDNYIKLKNEEKKYTDSIYAALCESSFYSDNKDNKKKIKEAGLLMNKIITFKIMAAQNLKNYYIYGERNSRKTVDELDREIENLSKHYSRNYQDIMSVE
jgi:hypothetical protein